MIRMIDPLHRQRLLIGALYLQGALAPGYLLAGIGFVAWRVLRRYGRLPGTGEVGVAALLPADHLATMIDTMAYGLGLPWTLLSLLLFPAFSGWAWWRRWLPWWFQLLGWALFLGGWLLIRLDPGGIVGWYFT